MFFHLVDLNLVNAWILHNIAAKKPMTHLDFRLAVTKELLEQNLIVEKKILLSPILINAHSHDV